MKHRGRRNGSAHLLAPVLLAAGLVMVAGAVRAHAASGWTVVTTPKEPQVPGELNIIASGPGPRPTVVVKEPGIKLFRHRMNAYRHHEWELSVQLLASGTTTVAIQDGRRTVARTSVTPKPSGGAVIGRIIGGIILLGGFLWMWTRSRRLYQRQTR